MILVANTPYVITMCNIESVNTDPSTFICDPETGEIIIKRKGFLEIEGVLFLSTTTGEVADITIELNLSGVPIQIMYTGITNQRTLFHYQRAFNAGDVLTFTATSPDNVTVENFGNENYFTIKRIY